MFHYLNGLEILLALTYRKFIFALTLSNFNVKVKHKETFLIYKTFTLILYMYTYQKEFPKDFNILFETEKVSMFFEPLTRSLFKLGIVTFCFFIIDSLIVMYSKDRRNLWYNGIIKKSTNEISRGKRKDVYNMIN